MPAVVIDQPAPPHDQAPMTDEALEAGLACLGRKLARPGRRIIFRPLPRDNGASAVGGG
jgi:hypothetical protein